MSVYLYNLFRSRKDILHKSFFLRCITITHIFRFDHTFTMSPVIMHFVINGYVGVLREFDVLEMEAAMLEVSKRISTGFIVIFINNRTDIPYQNTLN